MVAVSVCSWLRVCSSYILIVFYMLQKPIIYYYFSLSIAERVHIKHFEQGGSFKKIQNQSIVLSVCIIQN